MTDEGELDDDFIPASLADFVKQADAALSEHQQMFLDELSPRSDRNQSGDSTDIDKSDIVRDIQVELEKVSILDTAPHTNTETTPKAAVSKGSNVESISSGTPSEDTPFIEEKREAFNVPTPTSPPEKSPDEGKETQIIYERSFDTCIESSTAGAVPGDESEQTQQQQVSLNAGTVEFYDMKSHNNETPDVEGKKFDTGAEEKSDNLTSVPSPNKPEPSTKKSAGSGGWLGNLFQQITLPSEKGADFESTQADDARLVAVTSSNNVDISSAIESSQDTVEKTVESPNAMVDQNSKQGTTIDTVAKTVESPNALVGQNTKTDTTEDTVEKPVGSPKAMVDQNTKQDNIVDTVANTVESPHAMAEEKTEQNAAAMDVDTSLEAAMQGLTMGSTPSFPPSPAKSEKSMDVKSPTSDMAAKDLTQQVPPLNKGSQDSPGVSCVGRVEPSEDNQEAAVSKTTSSAGLGRKRRALVLSSWHQLVG